MWFNDNGTVGAWWSETAPEDPGRMNALWAEEVALRGAIAEVMSGDDFGLRVKRPKSVDDAEREDWSSHGQWNFEVSAKALLEKTFADAEESASVEVRLWDGGYDVSVKASVAMRPFLWKHRGFRGFGEPAVERSIPVAAPLIGVEYSWTGYDHEHALKVACSSAMAGPVVAHAVAACESALRH